MKWERKKKARADGGKAEMRRGQNGDVEEKRKKK